MPSRRPSTPAEAPLEVARAGKPSPARIRAEPASQALAMTKNPGSRCNAWKRFAFSLWLDVTSGLLAELCPRHIMILRGMGTGSDVLASKWLKTTVEAARGAMTYNGAVISIV